MIANQEEKKSSLLNHKLTLVGEVVSDKMDKTIVVKTMRTFQHERLGKVMKATKNYKVHDERQEAKLGDIVEFYEGRPVAKTKYMYLARIVKKA